MPVKQTKAVVLAVKSHGEADKIVTFYGQETGKFKGIAKGAKRSLIRFVNKLELFSLLELDYEEGRHSSLARIDQAELLQPFPAIRRYYPGYAAASLISELVQVWTKENDLDPRVFSLLVWGLIEINAAVSWQNLARVVIFFEIKLLNLLGYRPQLTNCLGCGTMDSAARPYHFSLANGGLLCRNCNQRHHHGLIPLSVATARILSKAQDLAIAKLSRLQLSLAGAKEATNLLNYYSRHLLQRDLHSRKLLWAALSVQAINSSTLCKSAGVSTSTESCSVSTTWME